MPFQKRCFSTTKALRRLSPEILCNVLRKYPDYLDQEKVRLPKDADPRSMPYDDICRACMKGDVPTELDDVLFYASLLGNTAGWEQIETEARFLRLNIDFPTEGLSAAEFAMSAWLHDWPNNRYLLEHTYARSKIHGRSAYSYYAPAIDLRSNYRSPTSSDMERLKDELSDYFLQQQMGRGTAVVKYEYDKEVWFLVRYPGHVRRFPSFTDDGEPSSQVFRPEEYDAIVYHKEYGDLRINSNRKKEHLRYRIIFADLLLNAHNVFHPKWNMMTLEPLKGDYKKLFTCGDIPQLESIVPIEIEYSTLSAPDIKIRMCSHSDATLMTYPRLERTLLPEDTAVIFSAKFRYSLANGTKNRTLIVHQGRRLTYARDGDSSVLEDWLRRRGFILSLLQDKHHVSLSDATA